MKQILVFFFVLILNDPDLIFGGQKRYMESVPLIIPLLEKEYRSTTRKLHDINQELRSVIDLVALVSYDDSWS